jgi:hypothetical protein
MKLRLFAEWKQNYIPKAMAKLEASIRAEEFSIPFFNLSLQISFCNLYSRNFQAYEITLISMVLFF